MRHAQMMILLAIPLVASVSIVRRNDAAFGALADPWRTAMVRASGPERAGAPVVLAQATQAPNGSAAPEGAPGAAPDGRPDVPGGAARDGVIRPPDTGGSTPVIRPPATDAMPVVPPGGTPGNPPGTVPK